MELYFNCAIIFLCAIFIVSISNSIKLENLAGKQFQGRYTRDVGDYEILVPRRVDCHGSFVSYSVPKYYKRNGNRKKRNTPSDDEKLHYDLHFDGKNHLIELWPNHDFLSPGLVTETWGEGAASDLNEVKIRSVGDNQCHYTGKIKGFPETRVAVSLCNGMAGHIRTKRHHYLIEPVKDHGPEDDGQHLHMIYTRTPSQKRKRTCGLNDNWQTAWSKRLGNEFRERKGANTDLRAEHTKRMRKVEEKAPISYSNSKRGTTSELNYMEILMVADKKFLQHYNGSDYEQYLFTILNMVSDLFHDASVGNEIDVNLVRVIYLEKEENELDLMINTDAPSTLENFCRWSDSMNFETSHPNHHDIAVLVTKYDICVKGKCDTAGLAYVAGACQKGLSCAYCEDLGLSLATVMTHEIGHLLGSDHDKEEENLPVGECPAMADDYRIHVMSPWSQLATANWSACSKKFITEFLENDLGKCLLDEPQDHSFKIPEMPPGVVYDAIWQCSQLYGPSKPCDMGPERNCKQLSCETPDGKSCMTNGDPPADGTSCGVNKWCYERKCVEIGGRPEAVNGGWSEWSSWSSCSRTCGGGASYTERKCDNPAPANHGRYCLGRRRLYKLCSTEPCEEDALTFREVQCKEHDADEIKWTPYNDGKAEHVCALVCSNNQFIFKVVEPRVKDGTACKRGSKDRCIAGECRKVGCDWVLDSNAVEDKCGVCNGDGSTCRIYDKIFNETKKDKGGYQKILTIPVGCRKISIEEVKISQNFLALGAPDEKTFYLNGNYNIEEEGESKVAGTYCVYTEVEPDREEIILGGPLKQDLAVYILYNGAENPGIHVEYSCPLNASVSGNLVNSKQVQEAKGTSHEAKQSVSHWDNSCSDNSTGTNASKQVAHKYHWELVDWGPCSAFCGGGTQISQPSCIDESGGKVALKYCQNVTKPEGTARVCNDQPCKTRWRTSEWSKCDGCVERPGTRKRLVECVKESPIADSVVIVDDKDCHQEKPVDQESCTSKEPCNTTDTSEAKGHEQNYEVNSKKPETGTEDKDLNECENVNNENTMSNNKAKNKTGSIVIDTIPPEKIKVIQMPLIKDSKQFNMSDEAVESIGDSVPSLVDVCKAKEATGEEALKQLLETKKKNEEKTEKEENKKYDELTLEDKNTSSNTIETKDSDSCETTTIDLECGDSEFSTSFEGTTSMSTSTVESQDKKGFKFSSLFGLPSIQNGVDKIERNDMKEIKKDIQLNEPLGLKDKNNKRGNVRDLKVKAKFEKNERISSPAKNKYEHIEGRERSSKNHVDSGKDDTKVKEEVENVEDEKMSELNENKNDPKVKELEEGEEESKESRMPVLRKSNDIGKANNGKKLKREEFKNMVKSNIGTKKLNYEKFSDRVESKYNSKIPAGKETKFSKFLSRRDFKEDPNTQDAGKAIKDSKFSEGSENKDESKVREVSKETKLPSWKDNKEDVKYNGGVKCEHFSREDKVAKREGKEGGKGTRLKDELKGKEEIQEATKLEKGIELQQFQGKDSYEMRKRCEQECKDEDCDQECDEECDKDCENDCDNCQNECEDEDEDDCGKECENECGQECKKDCGNDCQKECGKECIKECLNKYKNQT